MLLLVAAAAALAAAQDPVPAAPVDFRKDVAPILIARCVECHGEGEQKGDLRLDAREHVFPDGGEDGWTVVPGKPEESELLRRLALPADDDDVMPAKGEPLSTEQQRLVREWIAAGAPWSADDDAWLARELAARSLPRSTFVLPELGAEGQAAIDAAVAALRERGAAVLPVAADTPALDVNLSLLRDKIGDAELALLVPLAPRLVWLDLSRTAITDGGARHLARLVQLRRLNVAETKLGDAAFRSLAALEHLEHVNAYGTALGDDGLGVLAKLPRLTKLYAWQTKVTDAGAAAARAVAPKLVVDRGEYVADRLAAAEQEVAEITARRKVVNETCPVAGKPVDAAHVLDHDGRRVGFCCAKCKAAFEKDPAKYAAKLPPKK